MVKEFVPFGPEWEKSILQISKKEIVYLFKKVAQENIELKEKLKNA